MSPAKQRLYAYKKRWSAPIHGALQQPARPGTPDGRLRSTAPTAGNLHVHDLIIPAGIPADLLRPSARVSTPAWYEVLSADLDMAAASKDRFPRLSLTASYGGTSSPALGTMVSSGFNFWSLGRLAKRKAYSTAAANVRHTATRITELNRIEQSWLHRVYRSLCTSRGSTSAIRLAARSAEI